MTARVYVITTHLSTSEACTVASGIAAVTCIPLHADNVRLWALRSRLDSEARLLSVSSLPSVLLVETAPFHEVLVTFGHDGKSGNFGKVVPMSIGMSVIPESWLATRIRQE